MGSQMQDGGGGDRPHKPFLIDPAEEGTKPQGVDAAWWAWLILGSVQELMPRRFRGLPPLFYLPSLEGILWGTTFLVFRIFRLPIPAGMVLEPAPPLPTAVLDLTAMIVAATGIAQGVGTLYRKKWGLTAAYVWFALEILLCWLVLGWLEAQSESDVVSVVGTLATAAVNVAFIIYYHNRRRWFGMSSGQ